MTAAHEVAMRWEPYSPDQQSGHQGDGSRAAEPGRRKRLVQAYLHVIRCGPKGSTWAEYAVIAGIHHGSASSALSNLHRTGMIVRLAQRRGGSGIYVLPQHAEGRETKPYRARGGQGGQGRAELVARVQALAGDHDQRTIDAVIAIIEGEQQ